MNRPAPLPSRRNPAPAGPAPRSATEPAPGTAADSILISPRVLDQAAFERFAGTLRELIDDAEAKFRSAAAAADRADALLRRLTDAAPALEGVFQSRISAAGATLEALDSRASAADAVLARALEQARTAESLRTEIEAARREALAELGAGAAAARAEANEDLERAEARAERLRAEVALLARTGLNDLAGLCARAEALLGGPARAGEPEAPEPAPESLAGVVRRAESLRHEADFATRQLAEVRKQADAARTLLSQSLAETSALIDQVTERQAALRESLKEALAALDAAEKAVRERIDAAKPEPRARRKAG